MSCSDCDFSRLTRRAIFSSNEIAEKCRCVGARVRIKLTTLKRCSSYYEANRVGDHVRGLGIPNFRMATVTTTLQRVEQMIEAQLEITNGRSSNIFLLIDA